VKSPVVAIPLADVILLGERGLSEWRLFGFARKNVAACASRELVQLGRKPSGSQVVWQRAKTTGKPNHQT